ncbi:helix-turn-helix domain-containing protein [Streptosporangium sp. G12]
MSEGQSGAPAVGLWRRITQELAVRDWDIGDLAERSGVHRNTISRLKKQPTPPLTKTVNALALTLNIPIREAFELAGLEAPVETTTESVLEGYLASLLERVPAGRRAHLERMRADERDRLERLRQQAREDYERQIGRIAELARVEVEAGEG